MVAKRGFTDMDTRERVHEHVPDGQNRFSELDNDRMNDEVQHRIGRRTLMRCRY